MIHRVEHFMVYIVQNTVGCVLYRLEVLSSPVLYSEPGQQMRRYAAFHTFDRVSVCMYVCIIMYICTAHTQ